MLSPNVIDAREAIAGAFSQYNVVQAFANGVIRTVISPLSPDPEWLTPLRSRMGQLKIACEEWQSSSPDILVDFLTPFIKLAPLIDAIAVSAEKGAVGTPGLIQLLTAVQREMNKFRSATKAAERRFTRHIQGIVLAEKDLDHSLQVGWAELAKQEQEMIRIAKAITTVQDRVDRLQDSLTGAGIASGKRYFQTAATISYTLVTTTGEEVPFLSIVSEIYTSGKMAHDLIVTDKGIDEAIDEIRKLRGETTEAAQAAAMAKGIIQMINTFDKRMAGMSKNLPTLDEMWKTEAGKVQSTLHALESGADPATLPDLVTLKSAAASWRELATLAQLCINFQIESGKAVTILTDHTLAKAIA